MALSTCIKCESKRFELKELEAQDSAYRIYAVQCAKCGGVVGIRDYHNVPVMIQKLAKALNLNMKW